MLDVILVDLWIMFLSTFMMLKLWVLCAESGGAGESDMPPISWGNKQQIYFFVKSFASVKIAHLGDIA